LVFEGNFSNGEITGKGKEYLKGCLFYEGEYQYGKKNGKGKEFDDNGNVQFEGLFFEGKKILGKEYYEGELNFCGIYCNDERLNGYGKEYQVIKGKIQKVFEGYYFNGKRWNGKGKEYRGENNLVFDGDYLNGKQWNGFIKEYCPYSNLIFKGTIRNGERNGYGKEFEDTKVIFSGQYKNGKRNGKGVEKKANGLLIFDGTYINDHIKEGKYYIKGILEFEGTFLFDHKWEGKGYDKDKTMIYELKNGKGKVMEYDEHEILRYEGYYLNGKRDGEGKEYNSSGSLIYEGEFSKGKWNGNGKKYVNGKLIAKGKFLDGKIRFK